MKASDKAHQKIIQDDDLLNKIAKDLKISQKKVRQMEKALFASELKCQTIFEIAGAAMLIVEEDMTIARANKAASKLTGCTRDEMEGKKKWTEFIKKSDSKKISSLRQLKGPKPGSGTKSYKVQLAGRDGQIKNISLNIDLLPGTKCSVVSLLDITDRKQVQEKYKGIFENAVMGIFQATSEGSLISANPAFARILGYETPEEILNRITDVSRQLMVNPQDLHQLLELIDKGDVIHGREIQLTRKDGNTVWVYASGRAIRDGMDKLLYYEGTIQDLTDRRRLESQLIQAQKMEAIGTLAGGISHDFNNILASIMGFTEMAAREDRHDIRKKYFDRVLQSCARAKDLINQILSFTRKQEQEKHPVDVKSVIEEALTLLRATLPSTIEIRQELPPEQSMVFADPTQIHQILINLCANAAHAMREKGGLLEVKTSNIETSSSSASPHSGLKSGSYVKLTVRDTGHGIDPAIKDKIFDPFFTTKKVKEGTGLGLSVVYGIVKSYGGDIDVQSYPGEGAVFTIYLPRIHQDNRVEKTCLQNMDLKGNERILFVDDEQSLVTLAQAYFDSMGYQITAKIKSADALKLFGENPEAFDLLITDMTMPDITGTQLAREFLKIRPNLPIILCTGYSDAVNAELCSELKIREMIIKPFSLKDLGILVRRVLNS